MWRLGVSKTAPRAVGFTDFAQCHANHTANHFVKSFCSAAFWMAATAGFLSRRSTEMA